MEIYENRLQFRTSLKSHIYRWAPVVPRMSLPCTHLSPRRVIHHSRNLNDGIFTSSKFEPRPRDLEVDGEPERVGGVGRNDIT